MRGGWVVGGEEVMAGSAPWFAGCILAKPCLDVQARCSDGLKFTTDQSMNVKKALGRRKQEHRQWVDANITESIGWERAAK
jgi:hypothetical protein